MCKGEDGERGKCHPVSAWVTKGLEPPLGETEELLRRLRKVWTGVAQPGSFFSAVLLFVSIYNERERDTLACMQSEHKLTPLGIPLLFIATSLLLDGGEKLLKSLATSHGCFCHHSLHACALQVLKMVLSLQHLASSCTRSMLLVVCPLSQYSPSALSLLLLACVRSRGHTFLRDHPLSCAGPLPSVEIGTRSPVGWGTTF